MSSLVTVAVPRVAPAVLPPAPAGRGAWAWTRIGTNSSARALTGILQMGSAYYSVLAFRYRAKKSSIGPNCGAATLRWLPPGTSTYVMLAPAFLPASTIARDCVNPATYSRSRFGSLAHRYPRTAHRIRSENVAVFPCIRIQIGRAH